MFNRSFGTVAFLIALGAVPVVANVPGGIDITCDVPRSGVPNFRSAAAGQTTVTFRLWSADTVDTGGTGGTLLGSYDVQTSNLAVAKRYTDRYASVKSRKAMRINATIGSDDSPVVLPPDGKAWLEVVVGATTLGCDFAARNDLDAVTAAWKARRRIQSAAFAAQGGSGSVPSGAILLWDGAACPAGFTRLTSYDNLFLVGAATAGTTGGSNTHDHGGVTGSHVLTIAEMPTHSHSSFIPVRDGLSGGDSDFLAGNGSGNYYARWVPTNSQGGDVGHTHAIGSADSRPAFKTIVLCKKD